MSIDVSIIIPNFAIEKFARRAAAKNPEGVLSRLAGYPGFFFACFRQAGTFLCMRSRASKIWDTSLIRPDSRRIWHSAPSHACMPLRRLAGRLGADFSCRLAHQRWASRREKSGINPVLPDKAFLKRFSRPPHLFPIKILYLQETSQISGAENSLIKLVENIDKTKFKPIFILPSEGPFSRKLRQSGIEVILINFPKIRRVTGVFKTVKEMLRIVKEKNAALIHSNSIRTNIYAVIAGKLSGTPVIWHQRNLITNEIIDPDRFFGFMPDRIICNSYAIARRFTRKADLPARIKVIHNGVDIKEFNPAISGAKIRKEFNIKPDEIVVGTASRFNEYKGHDVFFRAAGVILAETPEIAGNLRFLIAGGAVFEQDKPRERYLRNIVKDLNLVDKVIFAGFRDDMPEVYAAMDIFVLPSRAEACGRVIFEAMASGKPVVATDSGGTPEIVVDGVTGCLFKPDDVRILADKIAFLAKNVNTAKKFGAAGRKRIEENFKIEKNVGQIEEVYMGLVQK